ncbi:MAG: 2-dehydropantoate 2-reductase [Chloroflexi bacterium]|nr:2-dehydropantoate 2-reductase [Chloroflexota bacterium]
MKIAIMGTGGVGGYFGGLLARAGNDVTFIARGAHLQAIRQNGLRVESLNDGDFVVHGNAVQDTSQAGFQDLVLFTVKMYHNEDAIDAIRPLMGPSSVVLTLQNGIDNGEQLVEAFGRERVLIGSCYMEGRIKEPGVVTQGGPGMASFGELEPGITGRCQQLLAVFQEANWRVELQENMPGMLWKKFSYLAGSAAVGAATRTLFGEMRAIPETRAIIQGAIEEILEVGRASGAPIMEDSLQWCMTSLDNFPATGMSSLGKDFLEGRPVELDGLTGTAIDMARRYGVATPINDTLYGILKPWALAIERDLARAGAGNTDPEPVVLGPKENFID